MKEIRKFRDMPDWPEFRKALKEEVGRDPKLVAEFGEIEGAFSGHGRSHYGD
jgi:hypothetical protein